MPPKSGMGKIVLWIIGLLAVVGIGAKAAMNKSGDNSPAPVTPSQTDTDGGKDEAMTTPSPSPVATDDGGSDADSATGSAMEANTGSTEVASTDNATYKDGTYTAEGDYRSPGGPEHIMVTLTIKGNVVTDANVKSEATLQKSQYMQGQFISGYKDAVIGKNLNEINVGKTSGSSLTPIGFNDAVTKIKAQAVTS